MSENDEAEQLRKWLEERPPAIREAATKYPGGRHCYRSSENPRFHYRIHSYFEEDDGSVTVRLIHGADSTLPGLGTFGQPIEQLIPCDCGFWQHATEAQKRATKRELERRFRSIN